MPDINISLAGVALATIAGMALGAFWYSNIAFGRAWLRCIGKTEEQLGSPMGPLIGSIFACLLSAFTLAIVVSLTSTSGFVDGTLLGVLLGLGLVFPAMLSDSLFCGWGLRLLCIQASYRILYIIIMSGILAAFQ